MSYLRNRYGRRRVAMGDIGATITSLTTAAGIAADIAQDPYLPETVCRIGQLKAIHAGQTPGACITTKSGLRGGVGLGPLVKPLRAYVYAEAHPWAYGVAFAGLVALPLAIGYALGRSRR